MIARVVFVAAATLTCSLAADLYPVSGTVLNVATDSPLQHARVYFYRSSASGGKPVASAITGDNGRFQFQLPAGSYVMRAGTRDIQENYGARNPSNSIASAVIVGPDKETANLVFRFFPPAAIYGRVMDDAGEPAPNVLVQLIRMSVSGGRRTAATFAFERTNDLGEYRFGRLPGDTAYYLAVTGEPSNPQATATFAPVYFPNVPDPAKATPIFVKAGEEALADFALTPAPGANVTVRHDAPQGTSGTISLTYKGVADTIAVQQSAQIVAFRMPARNAPADALTQEQVLNAVPPGHYTLAIYGSAGSTVYWASREIDVNGAPLEVDLPVKPVHGIKGTVHFPPDASQGSTSVSIRGLGGGSAGTVAAARDGAFAFPSVTPGSFRVSIGGSAGYYATGMEAHGGSFHNGILDVPEGSDVELSITVSNETGGVHGFVTDKDRPVEGVFAILASTGDSGGVLGEDARARVYQTESDGSFDFRAIPAGHYLLFGTDNTQLEYSRPEVIAPYLAHAKPIEIRAQSSTDERIPLLPAPQR
ncbi:MAG TPA: carboxypeptidase-like regulatory domain-containing protein [Bryobacteraceae bacterium]|nr:carboxypeptidase-like regulatory domain-containing protein [Bryobacteraceae bacterium]